MRTILIAMAMLYASIGLSQKYKTTFHETITYNQEGHSGTVEFKCEYDVFMQEPTVKAIAKVRTSNDGCKPSLLNVTVDIYSGSTRVSTVTFNNLISIDVAGSPNWNKLWPGVSEDRAKQLYKQGFSIRNARLTNVKFSADCGGSKGNEQGGTASESGSNNQEEKKKAEEERAAKEREAKAEAQRQEQEKKQEQQRREQEAKQKRKAQEQARQQEIERAQAERARKQAAYEAEQKRRQRNMERKRQYDQQVQEQKNRNVQKANTFAASNLGSFALIAMVLYQDMGKVKAKHTYVGNQLNIGIDMGYSLSSFPIVFNSFTSTMVYNPSTGDNEYVTKKIDEDARVSPLNLEFKPFIGYEHRYGGIELYGKLKPGTTLIFDGFNLSYNYGGKIYGGLPFARFYYEYRRGVNRFMKIDWIDPEELGAGDSKFTYKQHSIGARFSFTTGNYSYARHHIQFGWIFENIIEGTDTDDGKFRAYYYNLDPDKRSRGDDAYFRIKGYRFEWTKEHNFNLYINYYPNYPFTGIRAANRSSDFNARENGGTFVEVGFVRQIKAFYSL